MVLLPSRYSNLILNLFSLMVDANIPDIALEPDKTVKKVRLLILDGKKLFSVEFRRHLSDSTGISRIMFEMGPQVQDKFRLDLSDEEAVHYMQSLIDESVGALFAAVVEQIHKFAQVRLLKHTHKEN